MLIEDNKNNKDNKKNKSNKKTVLRLDNICKSFYKDNKELIVLDDINFQVTEGEIVALTGPSGCGKSTILNLISGLETPSSGDFYKDGEIGYMFQKDHLFNYRTVYRNVILGLEIKKKHKDEKMINEVNRLLETYGLKEFVNNHPNELSGGMKQRVALIRTLAVKPDILLLDEPFGALDYQTKMNVIDDIYKIIKKENRTTIFVTHDISEAISIADKVIVLSKRPSKIKKIYNINLTINGERTPFESRKAPEFKEYFDKIWKEFTDE